MRRLSILGSTGSIGRSALDVVRHLPDRFKVAVLAAHSSADLMAEQIREFEPECVAMGDPAAARQVSDAFPGLRVLSGPEGLIEAAAADTDVCLCAMVGAAGLRPLLRAIDAGHQIALANKESLVMAGGLVMERVRQRGVRLVPVDSEHNAVFQCLSGHRREDVHLIHLTASGGPFYGLDRSVLSRVTPEQATRHPTWDMGAKISVDSATLMNKGLEVIEAMWLFDLPIDQIEVLIHPQSIVHSLVEFTDGSILGHLGVTDMKFPILFALSWPERVQSPMGRLNLAEVGRLTFAAPDFGQFPCLGMAIEAARAGGTAPTALNAANEAAVAAFCAHRINFLDIEEVVRRTMDAPPSEEADSIETVEMVDARTRRRATGIIESLTKC